VAGLILVELVALILLAVALVSAGALPGALSGRGNLAAIRPAVRVRVSQPAPLDCPYQAGPDRLTRAPWVLAICANQARDAARRLPLSPSDQEAADARVAFVRSVVLPPSGHADPLQAANHLTQAGFTHFLVRYARASDPAPAGSLLWGVDVDPGCVIGYSGIWSSATAVGYLPDGTCLSS
jgi:hypothetical protein